MPPRKRRPRPKIVAPPIIDDDGQVPVSGRADPPDLESVMLMLSACVLLLGGEVLLTPIELAQLKTDRALGIKYRKENREVLLTLSRIKDLPPASRAVVEQDRKLSEGKP